MSKKKWEDIAVEETAEDSPVNPEKKSESFAGGLEHPSYEALEARLTELEEEARTQTEKAVRAVAEAENIRKRAAEDVRKARDYSLTEFARELLAVADSLEQALQTCLEHAAMKEGVELTLKQLHSALERFGIKVFDPCGEKFNPSCHEAMTMVEDKSVESGKIITVFQKGYWIADRLLRPARVVVAK